MFAQTDNRHTKHASLSSGTVVQFDVLPCNRYLVSVAEFAKTLQNLQFLIKSTPKF